MVAIAPMRVERPEHLWPVEWVAVTRSGLRIPQFCGESLRPIASLADQDVIALEILGTRAGEFVAWIDIPPGRMPFAFHRGFLDSDGRRLADEYWFGWRSPADCTEQFIVFRLPEGSLRVERESGRGW